MQDKVDQLFKVMEGPDVVLSRPLALEILRDDHKNTLAMQALATCDYLERNYTSAARYYMQIAALEPGNVMNLGNMAEAFRRNQEPERALPIFRKLLSIDPDYFLGLLGMANCLNDLGQFEEAVKWFVKLLRLNPAFAPAYHYLGAGLIDTGRVKEALPLLRKAVALRVGYDEALITLADALEKDGQNDAAKEIMDGLLTKNPDNPSFHAMIGNWYRMQGNMEQALEHFRIAKQNDKHSHYGSVSMAGAMLGPEDEGDLVTLEELLLDTSLNKGDRRSVHFALGKLYDDTGRYDEAWNHFKIGNDSDDRDTPFDERVSRSTTDGLKKLYSKDFFDAHKHYGCLSDLPIYIVGMPRSGTSLLEQTLSSLPGVYGGGELNLVGDTVRSILKHMPSKDNYVNAIGMLDPVTATNIGDGLSRRMQEMSGGLAQHVTDKMPGNSQNVGLLQVVLPRAKILNCTRNPMDVALSQFSKCFASVISYSRNIDWLAAAHIHHHELMAHWHEVLPGKILDVPYERMVEDHEGVTRGVLDFLGLQWDDTCRDFFNTKRAVKTASVWQVRQPIYKSSVEKWRNYEKHMMPLAERLRDAGILNADFSYTVPEFTLPT